MKLVMFKFAIEHVSRISRVLKQDNGHVLLIGELHVLAIVLTSCGVLHTIGVGGSGRQSASKLATFMADYDLFQIEITKNYTTVEWREDLKRVGNPSIQLASRILSSFLCVDVAEGRY